MIKRKSKYGFACLLFALCFIFLAHPVQAKADEWQKIGFSYNTETNKYNIVKVGNYSFQLDSSNGEVLIKSYYSPYKRSKLTQNTWTDGKTAYYVRKNKLYKYTLSTGKTKKLVSLPRSKSVAGFYVSKVYKDYIYLTSEPEAGTDFKTYSYGIKTKKLKKIKNCAITLSSGKYCLCQVEYRSDVSPSKILLCSCTNKGKLKTIKSLSNASIFNCLINGKFYYQKYAKYGSNNYGKVTLYRCNLDGSKRKKLGTFRSSKNGGFIYFFNITEQYCEYSPSADRSLMQTYYY